MPFCPLPYVISIHLLRIISYSFNLFLIMIALYKHIVVFLIRSIFKTCCISSIYKIYIVHIYDKTRSRYIMITFKSLYSSVTQIKFSHISNNIIGWYNPSYIIISYYLNSWKISNNSIHSIRFNMVRVSMSYKKIFNVIKFVFYVPIWNTTIEHHVFYNHTVPTRPTSYNVII